MAVKTHRHGIAALDSQYLLGIFFRNPFNSFHTIRFITPFHRFGFQETLRPL